MYSNQSKKRVNRTKISLSDQDVQLIDAAVEIDGGQRAVITRDLLINWARSVVQSARANGTAPIKSSIGIVSHDGGIRYRLAA